MRTINHTHVSVPLIEWLQGYEGDTIAYWAEDSYHYAELEGVVATDMVRVRWPENHADHCALTDYHSLINRRAL